MDDLDLARYVADQASQVVRSAFGAGVTPELKGEVDPVTAVDRAAERVIRSLIGEHRPDDAIMAEEEGGELTSGRTWIADPLDGTVNFVHAIPHVAVSVALYDGSDALVGVVVDVMRQEEFSARRGDGAWLKGERISVSSTPDLSSALVGIGFPYDRRQRAAEYGAMASRMLTATQGLRRMGSAALDLAYVAAGRLDAYAEMSVQPWDVAAGQLLVREAGGMVTGADAGTRPIGSTDPVVASNGLIHGSVVELI